MNMSSIQHVNPWKLYDEAILNFWQNNDDTPLLVHTDIAETEEMPPSYFFRDQSDWPDHELEMLDLAFGKVLEIGAGVGSHALELQKKGLEVHANESSKVGCQIMQERGLPHIIPGDFGEINGSFDTILLVMNGLGMAKSPEGLQHFLTKMKSLLNQNGKIIFDAADISHLHESKGFINTQYNNNYYGIVSYQFEYCGNLGKSFQWLFVDKVLLFEIAESLDLEVTILMEDRQFGYSAVLNLK